MKRNSFKYSAILMYVFAFLFIWIVASNTVIISFASAFQNEEVTLTLNSRNTEENVRFEVKNMLPGDAETEYYRVKASFKDDVVIHFDTVLQPGYEKLAEVLKVKVKLISPVEKELYDGLMKDMKQSLDYSLSASDTEKTAELCYEICGYLDTQVGNEYQNQKLLADFIWWAEGEDASKDAGTDGSDADASDEATKSGDTSTGDGAPLVMFCIILMGSAVMFLTLGKQRKQCTTRNGAMAGTVETAIAVSSSKEKAAWNGKTIKLYMSIIAVIVLVIALTITTFAFAYNLLKVEDNLFITGEVSINLNDDIPVIGDNELLFEPGMTIKRDFFIANNGTCDVYYKLYVSNIVDDGLSKVLEVTVKDGEDILYEGMLADMERSKVESAETVLAEKERRELTIYFHFPEEEGNAVQDASLSFDIQADAVQTRNNPEREF